MISGMHGLFFTPEAEAARDVLRDAFELDYVDAGDGWLIFDVPDADVGAHPLDPDEEVFHELSFSCEDIEATVEELESRGVPFIESIEDKGFGLSTVFELPGGVPVQLFEPTPPEPGE